MMFNSLFFRYSAFLVVILAVLYNSLLSIVNFYITSVNVSHVMMFELFILFVSFCLIYYSGLYKEDILYFLFFLLIVFSFIFVSFLNDKFFLDATRNLAIILLFSMLGRRIDFILLKKIFLFISVVVFLFLLIEVFNTSLYVDIFHPGLYYNATRGHEIQEWNQSGLAGNTLSFEGRFGFGLFDGARTSSVFLEQTALGNFAVVITVFLTAFYRKINNYEKIMYISLILLVLITSRSRMATALVIFSFFSYFFIVYIPKWVNLLWMPFFIILSFVFYFYNGPGYTMSQLGDTINGRMYHTASLLISFDLDHYFAANVNLLGKYWDSGFSYVINSSGLFMLIGFWLFFYFIFTSKSRESLIVLMLSSLYFYATLSVSGTSAFSIKTAALLWVLIGFASSLQRISEITQSNQPRSA